MELAEDEETIARLRSEIRELEERKTQMRNRTREE
jgi:hypothetical protein